MGKPNFSGILSGIIVTVIGGFILALLVGEGRFAPRLADERGNGSNNADVVPTTSGNIQQGSGNGLPVSIDDPTREPESTPTIQGIRNPSGVVPLGEPIIVDGFQLYVDANSFEIVNDSLVGGPYLRVSFAVKNVDEIKRVFRFAPSSVTIRDDAGKVYQFIQTSRNCDSATPYMETKAVELQPGESVVIGSHRSGTSAQNWCFSNYPQLMPWYEGTIPAEATRIIFDFKGFGPFEGFSIEIPI